MRRLVNVLGVPVDDVTMAETIDRLTELVRSGRRSGCSHQVATVNVDFVVNAARNPELKVALQEAALSIPDGMPIVWASRVLGTRLRERVTGADLVGALAERAAMEGFCLYLFGSGPGVAGRAANALTAKYPSLRIIADTGPVVDSDGTMDVGHVERIAAARPDVVCVALGNPKQEFWIRHYAQEIGAPVFIGVGGTLDLIVGEKRRAPSWMQRCGLEWMFRTVQEPRRLIKRYAIDFALFFPFVARQAWIGRPRRHRSGLVTTTDPRGTILSLVGAPTLDDVEQLDCRRVEIVDVAEVARLDNAGADLLVSLATDSRERGCRLVVRSASDQVRQQLTDLRIDGIFDFEHRLDGEAAVLGARD